MAPSLSLCLRAFLSLPPRCLSFFPSSSFFSFFLFFFFFFLFPPRLGVLISRQRQMDVAGANFSNFQIVLSLANAFTLERTSITRFRSKKNLSFSHFSSSIRFPLSRERNAKGESTENWTGCYELKTRVNNTPRCCRVHYMRTRH